MRIASPSADVLLTTGDNAGGAADAAVDGDLFARLLQGEPAAASATDANKTEADSLVNGVATMAKTTGRLLDLMPTPVRTAVVEKTGAYPAAATAANTATTMTTTDDESVIATAATVADSANVATAAKAAAVAAVAPVAITSATITVAAVAVKAVTATAVTATNEAETPADPAHRNADEPVSASQPSRPTARLLAATTERSSGSEQSKTSAPASRRVAIEPSLARHTRVMASTHRDEDADDEKDAAKDDNAASPDNRTAPPLTLSTTTTESAADPAAKPATDAASVTIAQGIAVPQAPALTITALPPATTAADSVEATAKSSVATDAAIRAASDEATTNITPARSPARLRGEPAALSFTKASGKTGGNSGKELPSATQTDVITADNSGTAPSGNSTVSAQPASVTAGFQTLLSDQASTVSATAPVDTGTAAQSQTMAAASVNPATPAGGNGGAPAATTTSMTNTPLFNATYAMDSNGFGAETVHHIRWLKDHDLHSAELQLHPAELGRLSISIDIRDGQASVQLVANSNEARELLERALPELRQMLAQNGMTLGDSQVSQQQAHQQQRDGRGLRQLPEFFNMPDSPLQELTPGPALFRASGGSHRIDHYV